MSFCHQVRSQSASSDGWPRAQPVSCVQLRGSPRLWELEVGSLLAPDNSQILIKIVLGFPED